MNSRTQLHLACVIVLAVFTIFAAGCTGTAPSSGQGRTGTTVNVSSGNTGIHTIFVEPNDGRTLILRTIAGAQKTITLTIYQLDDPEIVTALAAAQERGVSVRIIYNNASFAAENVSNPNEYAIANLTPLGVQMMPGSPVFVLTHQKTLTADGSVALIMTLNLDPTFFGTTRDFGVITNDPAEIQEIEKVFEADWNYQNVTPIQPSLVWSPVNAREKILGLINGSTKTLDVYNDAITDPQVIGALCNAARRGVAVRVLAADNVGSNGTNVNAPALATLTASGAQAKSIASPYIHAKVAVADYGTPHQVAYVGSAYFAAESLDQSRNLGILVTEQPILDRIETEFNQDWKVPAVSEP
ncbi:phospholipase D-like domain-containing protein [Methanoregula sp.]|uniref:phospholipase D-like domain-containing protein n=1 Tax=Methanoregula sp. TaxID=2052170 RepID=UPI003BAECEDC